MESAATLLLYCEDRKGLVVALAQMRWLSRWRRKRRSCSIVCWPNIFRPRCARKSQPAVTSPR